MDFDFSDEQRLFSEQLRRALDTAAPLSAAHRAVESGQPDSATWRLLSDMGVAGAAIDEARGGNGAGQIALCLAAREIGWSLAAVPTQSLYLGATLIALAGTPEQQGAWLPRITTGEALVTVWSGEAGMVTVAGQRVSGNAELVADAASADAVILPVGHALWLVALDQPGVERFAQAVIDPGRPLHRLTFRNAAAVPLRSGSRDAALRHAIVYCAFEQLGAAERALDGALAYARERVTFGRQIASYQAVKHRLADMWGRIEIARAHAMYAAWALETGSADLALAAAAARATATDALGFVAQEALHLHGGFGFTFEADCHLFYRRARSLAARYGAAAQWRAVVTAQLVAGVEAAH